MLSRWWPKPKWIKHFQVGSTHPSGWNVTLYLQFKRSFFFFTQSASFPSWVFCSWFDPNAYKSSKVSQLQDLRRRTSTMMPVAFNITQTHLKLLTMAFWWKPHNPRITTPSIFHLFNASDVSLSLWLTA